MANFQKFGKSAAGHLAAHYERWKIKDPETGKEEYVKFGNQEIDVTRTHLNYNLGPEREIGQVDFIRKRISEVRCLNRDDVKILCSCVVTLPKENEYGEKMEYTDDQIRDFFEEAYTQLRDQHGEENVISCYVHMDETTPHMHFAFVPVVEDLKRGDLKVSAKEAINQTYLRRFHVELQRSMDERFGEGFFPVLNGNTDGGNRTIMQLKAEREAEKIADLQIETSDLSQKLEKQKTTMVQAVERIKKLDAGISTMNQRAENAKQNAEDLLSQKETLEGSVKLLKAEESELRDKTLPELRDEISNARDELRIVEAAIKRKKDEGAREYGSHEEMAARIARERDQEKKDQRLSLFEKFIQLPFVKPLWERFVLDQARGKERSKKFGEKDKTD